MRRSEQVLCRVKPRRAQELLAYLLLYRDRLHTREALANLLWSDSTTDQALKYLRHTLWQLQVGLDSGRVDEALLVADSEWVGLNPAADLWCDVVEFERMCEQMQWKAGLELGPQRVRTLQEVERLYRGDLLEGWYQDWCLLERVRLERLYLSLLETLIDSCEACGAYQEGLAYGAHALRHDVAHERIYQRLMCLHYLAGDRTSALRQYERCAAALREELNIEPSSSTVALYELIRLDQPIGSVQIASKRGQEIPKDVTPALLQVLEHLEQLQEALGEVQHHLHQTVVAIKMVTKSQDGTPLV